MEDTVLKSSLYDTDFYSWTREQAALLRAGRFQAIDVANIVEEIETLGRSEASALRSSLRLIAVHVLKLLYQPDKATNSWRGTIVRERINAERRLKDNPGLRSKLRDIFPQSYADARKIASAETGLPIETFPAAPPFSLEQVRSEAYMPGPTDPSRPDAGDQGSGGSGDTSADQDEHGRR